MADQAHFSSGVAKRLIGSCDVIPGDLVAPILPACQQSAKRAVQFCIGTGKPSLLRRILVPEAPVEEVAGIKRDAEEIGGDEAELRGAEADDANDSAVDRSHDPALPQFSADEHRTDDGQHAG